MAVTEEREVHQAGWTERTGRSFKGMLTGLTMFVGAIGLLFWNEGRAVRTARRLAEGAGAVVSVPADRVDSANEGKLVHVSGKAVTQEVLKDDAFGIAVNAIKLERQVEIYQWVEDAHSRTVKKGDKTVEETTYTYKKEWRSKPVDSSGFKEAGHGNPPAAMLFSDDTKLAADVRLGAFRLPADNINRIGGEKAYVFPQDYAVPAAVNCGTLVDGRIYVPFVYGAANAAAKPSSPLAGAAAAPAAAAPKGSPLAGAAAAPAAAAPKGSPLAGAAAAPAAAPKGSPLAGAAAAPAAAAPKGSPLAGAAAPAAAAPAAAAVKTVVGRNAAMEPMPGDLRVSFKIIEPHDLTVVEKQSGDSFVPWRASDGKSISFVRDGQVDAATIFENAKSGNNAMSLILRIFGFLLMFGGVKALLGPIATIVDAIPILNGIVAAGVGLVAFLVAGAVSLLTIGAAWIFYRPLLGGALIVGAGALIALIVAKRKKPVAA